MRNLLTSFDEFEENDDMTERDLQDYNSRYLDLYDEIKRYNDEKGVDISDDIVFEIELIKQIDINIDYILMLINKYHDGHCRDKELRMQIQKAVDASPELRSKKSFIESFMKAINEIDDVMIEWTRFIAEQREKDLAELIKTEKLNEDETRKFIDRSFREGEIKTIGTDIDKIMPSLSRFDGQREEKKQQIISKLQDFYEKYCGLGNDIENSEAN